MKRTTRTDPSVLAAALAEAWPAPADLRAFRAALLERARTQLRQRADQEFRIEIEEGVTGVSVTVSPGRTIGILVSPCAKPHVDLDFPAWSALWVLRARGHHLGIADHVPINPADTTRRPLRSPGLTNLPLAVGSIVLFNARRTHWMDAVPGRPRPVMFAASFDFSERPDRQTVEARIRTALAGA